MDYLVVNMTLTNKLLAACNDVIGCISPPPFITPGVDSSGRMPGIMSLANSLLRVVFIVAGLWALLNFILGGFAFMTAEGDPKKVALAWQKIWMTMIGLFLIVASFLLAAIVGVLLFHDPFAILNPKL
jgi:hypothetical protein